MTTKMKELYSTNTPTVLPCGSVWRAVCNKITAAKQWVALRTNAAFHTAATPHFIPQQLSLLHRSNFSFRSNSLFYTAATSACTPFVKLCNKLALLFHFRECFASPVPFLFTKEEQNLASTISMSPLSESRASLGWVIMMI